MALKAIIESLDDVSEAVRGEYKEVTIKDAKTGAEKTVFALDVDGVDTLPAVVNLKTAHERVKKDKTELATELAALKKRVEGLPEDVTAEQIAEMQAELEAFKADPNNDPKNKDARHQAEVQRIRQMLEQQINNLKTKSAEDLAAKDKEIDGLKQDINKLVVDDGLTKSLLEAGVKPNFLKAAKALLKDSVKVLNDDGVYKAVVETNLGEVELSKFVADWSNSNDGKDFVEKASGGGASGGSARRIEDNPWDTSNGKKPNMTQQGVIVKADKARAERLMRAAGVPEEKIKQTLAT